MHKVLKKRMQDIGKTIDAYRCTCGCIACVCDCTDLCGKYKLQSTESQFSTIKPASDRVAVGIVAGDTY